MKVICDRCGITYEQEDKVQYGYRLMTRLYAGTHDEVNDVNLCPECTKKFDEFAHKFINEEQIKWKN